MWLRIFALLLCSYSFGDFISDFQLRVKRQDASISDKNAKLESDNNCSCVYHYQCDKQGYIKTGGEGIIKVRIGGNILCEGGEFAGNYVCCKHRPGDEVKPPIVAEPSISVNRSCGKQLPAINVRIFNDEDELAPVVGEFPWIVQIFKKDEESSEWTFKGSGSLIHPSVVLTGNHVVVRVKSSDLIKVIVNGKVEIGEIGQKPHEERDIKEIVNHREYSSEMLTNDVALLVLKEPYNITHTPFINTICLRPNITYENKRCLVAGWGKEPNTNGTTKVLKKVELPALAHKKCEELLGKALKKKNYVFPESLMCAGGEQGRDACKGDGGSPLVCPTGVGSSMYQVGIVAWGIGCGKKDVPGAYANVIHLHDWIVSNLKERDINL